MPIKEDERHRKHVKNNLEEVLVVLEESINRVVDPTKMDAQTLFDFFLQKQRVETLDHMKPKHYIAAMNNLEDWYKSKKIAFPYPEWLGEVRSYWQGRLTDKP